MSIRIKAYENGPFVIAGSLAYRSGDGALQTTPGTAAALCRCGGTGNGPFCDGSHLRNGFRSEAIELTLEAAASSEEVG